MIHLLGHLHIQAGVGTGQDNILLGFLALPLHGLPLCILLLAQLHQQQSANLKAVQQQQVQATWAISTDKGTIDHQ